MRRFRGRYELVGRPISGPLRSVESSLSSPWAESGGASKTRAGRPNAPIWPLRQSDRRHLTFLYTEACNCRPRDDPSLRESAYFGASAAPVGITVGPTCMPHGSGSRRRVATCSEAAMVGTGMGKGGTGHFLQVARGRRRKRAGQPARAIRARRPLPGLQAASHRRVLFASRRPVHQWPQAQSRRIQAREARPCPCARVERDGLHVRPHRDIQSRCSSSV